MKPETMAAGDPARYPRSLATAALCDDNPGRVRTIAPILEHFGGVHCFSGPIQTVSVHQGSGLVRAALREGGRGRVLVVDAGGSTYAVIGDRASAFAQAEGWSGLVVNGHIRDIVGVAELAIGVMALGASPHKSDEPDIGWHGGVVRFGATTLSPGEWLYADEDGVVVSASRL